jgi:hypothetical protein
MRRGHTMLSALNIHIVMVERDIAARRLTMCGNHGFALQLAYGIAC